MQPPGSSIASRIVALAELLRRAGVAIGSAETLLATTAVAAIDLGNVADLAAALAAALLHRQEDRALFDAAFATVFLAARAGADPQATVPAARTLRPPSRRLAAPAADQAARPKASPTARVALEALVASDVENLRHRDFAQMSPAEARAAEALLRKAARWWRRPLRRWQADRRGVLDVRRTLREQTRQPDAAPPAWRSRRHAPLRLVLVCDISGSMSRYARAFLQLAHALYGRDRAVELFTFATRLTRATHLLRAADSDRCLARIGATVGDWDGGTRIGAALARLQREFGRRTLGSRTVVVLLTDGLERGDPTELRATAARLARACLSVVWLNPLLRYADYQPLARGAAALADTLAPARPAHDPASLAMLAQSLQLLAAGGGR